jgi:hypothetical protein
VRLCKRSWQIESWGITRSYLGLLNGIWDEINTYSGSRGSHTQRVSTDIGFKG